MRHLFLLLYELVLHHDTSVKEYWSWEDGPWYWCGP